MLRGWEMLLALRDHNLGSQHIVAQQYDQRFNSGCGPLAIERRAANSAL